MRNYTQLTQEQRYQIYALLKMDHTQIEIAKVIGVHKSTIVESFDATAASAVIVLNKHIGWQ